MPRDRWSRRARCTTLPVAACGRRRCVSAPSRRAPPRPRAARDLRARPRVGRVSSDHRPERVAERLAHEIVEVEREQTGGGGIVAQIEEEGLPLPRRLAPPPPPPPQPPPVSPPRVPRDRPPP